MSAGLGLAAVGFGAGVAEAPPYEPRHWRPGDDPGGEPGGAFVTPNWDWNVCHTYYTVPFGQGNVYPGILANAPAASSAGGVLVSGHSAALLAAPVGPPASRKWPTDCGIGIRRDLSGLSKKPPRVPSEAQRMFIKRPSHWVLGTAMAVALAYFASIATAEHESLESLP